MPQGMLNKFCFSNVMFSAENINGDVSLHLQSDFTVRSEIFMAASGGQYISVWSVDPTEFSDPVCVDEIYKALTELHHFYSQDPSVENIDDYRRQVASGEISAPVVVWEDRYLADEGQVPRMEGSLSGSTNDPETVRCLMFNNIVIGYLTPDFGIVKVHSDGREVPSIRFVFWWSSEGAKFCQDLDLNQPASPFGETTVVFENGGRDLHVLPGSSEQN